MKDSSKPRGVKLAVEIERWKKHNHRAPEDVADWKSGMWKLRNRKQLLKENEKLAKCLGEKAVQLCNSFNQMLQTEEKYFLFDTTKNVGVCVSRASAAIRDRRGLRRGLHASCPGIFNSRNIS